MRLKSNLVVLAAAGLLIATASCGGSSGGGNKKGADVSFQQYFEDSGLLDVTEVDPQIDSTTFAAKAPEAKLASATTTSFNEAKSFSTLSKTALAFDNSFFVPTDYIGAVDPDATTPWWKGWTLAEGDTSLESGTFHPLQAEIEAGTIAGATVVNCPAGTSDSGDTASIFGKTFPICNIDTDIHVSTELTNDHVYLVAGTINVGNGGSAGKTSATVEHLTMTVDAGVQIFGDATASTAGIVITRGSKINVNGTAAMPVVMSSADGGSIDTPANNFSGYNEWGGLILDGFAVVNAGAEVKSEAAPTGVDRYFGGDDPDDDSGDLHYIVITESGQEFRTDEEIQGLTVEGVGSGTLIDHIHVHQSGDDGIEWFGGTSNAQYVLITGPDDDGLDLDLGFQGGIQFAIVRQSANNHGDRGMESDNNGSNFDATPISTPTVSNITLLGNKGKDAEGTIGALHREGMAGFFHKVIYSDDTTAGGAFENGCVDIDNTQARIDEGRIKYSDSIFNCSSGLIAAPEDGEAAAE